MYQIYYSRNIVFDIWVPSEFDCDTVFMLPAWKVRRGHLVFGSSVRPSVCPSVRPSVCLSVRLSVRNPVPLINKVQYLKFGWSYSNQTWTVCSSKGFSHFTDIPFPRGVGRGQNLGLRDFAIFGFCCHRGHPCFTNTCLVCFFFEIAHHPAPSAGQQYASSTSSPEPLEGIWLNLVGMKYSWSPTSCCCLPARSTKSWIQGLANVCRRGGPPLINFFRTEGFSN